jgi:hypothetical protein
LIRQLTVRCAVCSSDDNWGPGVIEYNISILKQVPQGTSGVLTIDKTAKEFPAAFKYFCSSVALQALTSLLAAFM